MKQFSRALAIVILFAACNSSAYKKGRGGLEYKIISDEKGPLIKYGEFMQLNYATYYNNGKSDSLLEDTRNSVGPMIQMFDSVSTPMAYYEILRQLYNENIRQYTGADAYGKDAMAAVALAKSWS